MPRTAVVLLCLLIAVVGLSIGAPSTHADPPPPDFTESDALIPPDAPTGPAGEAAPYPSQTSEFMAGTVVYSVVFVESSGGVGNCSPADPSTENWDIGRQNAVLEEIRVGLDFWRGRPNSPILNDLTFQRDLWGTEPTSCEPITRPAKPGDQPKWIADVLTAMGWPATPANYMSVARSFVDSRRQALSKDWGFLIFVVDSLADADGQFSTGKFAYAYLNGPFMVMTYDNDGWGSGSMNLVTAHEAGHIFGAYDEYQASGCLPSDEWGYLGEPNTSCNNGGVTSDVSIMGEASEQISLSVDVSQSARNAIGWRNPAAGQAGHLLVDVLRNGSTSVTPYSPDPTSNVVPLYHGSASTLVGFPPGCGALGCHSSASISNVLRVEWRVDGGQFTSNDLLYDTVNEQFKNFIFQPASGLSYGTHTFESRLVTDFGYISPDIGSDTLTIKPDTDGDGQFDDMDACPALWTSWPTPIGDADCDAFTSAAEAFMGTDAADNCSATAALNDEAIDAWPPDNNDSKKADLSDILAYIPVFGTTGPGLPYQARYDLNADNQVGLADVMMFIPFFNVTCTP
ncbi:MAG: hypothetical protein Q7T33_06525 [Dehalococcoidia bacterium]|nr:hypothetical protein [Dehalococcoidia bacterium]